MKTKLTLIILLLAVGQAFAQPKTQSRESYSSGFLSAQKASNSTSHLAIKSPIFKSVDPQYRLDSLVVAGYFRYQFEYDAANRIESEIESEYDFSTLVLSNTAKTVYTYNAEGLIWKTDELGWDGTDWVNNYKYEYEYNAQGQAVTYLNSYWEESGAVWYTTKYIYVYDGSGNMSVETSYSWDSGTSGWMENSSTTYSYDIQNQLIMQVYSYYDYSTTIWIASDRTVYSYDSHGNENLTSSEYWDSSTESWVLGYQSQTEYTYDVNNNILSSISSDWDQMTSTWVYYSKEESTYDSFGNLLTQAYYDWNGSSWDPSDKQEIVYNTNISNELIASPGWLWEEFPSHHMITGASFSQWVAITWVPMFTAQFYYSSIISVPEAELANVNVYPNPVKSGDQLLINGLQAGSIYHFSMLDMAGKELDTQILEGGQPVSLKSTQPGLYMYRLKDTQGRVWNGKILVH